MRGILACTGWMRNHPMKELEDLTKEFLNARYNDELERFEAVKLGFIIKEWVADEQLYNFNKGDWQPKDNDGFIHEELVDIIDPTNPAYYKDKKIEIIDCIENIVDDLPPKEAFNAGQVIKYISRYNNKNGLEDLKKAEWYLGRLIKNVKEREE